MAKRTNTKKSQVKSTSKQKKKGLTKRDVIRKGKQLQNWGKWGRNDQLGVLNYITKEDIVEASKLIKHGKVFRLGLNLDEDGPQNSQDAVPEDENAQGYWGEDGEWHWNEDA